MRRAPSPPADHVLVGEPIRVWLFADPTVTATRLPSRSLVASAFRVLVCATPVGMARAARAQLALVRTDSRGAAVRFPERLARANRVFTNPVMRPLARRVSPLGVVHHVGRRSGKAYTSPVLAFPAKGAYLIPLTYGPDRDWVKNVVAAGTFQIERSGRFVTVTDPEVKAGDATDILAPRMARFVRRLDLEAVLTVRWVPAG